MIKKTLSALALIGAAVSAQAGTVIQQNFNNVAGLTAAGWAITNASTPGGSSNWFQGNQSVFSGQAGANDAYIAANYFNAPAGGTIDNWLITPLFSTANDVIISFWAKAEGVDGYSDQLAYGLSDGSTALANFTLGSAFTVPTDGWTQYSVFVNAMGAGTTGRFAIQYSGAADFSNYVGVDTLSVTVPEPSTTLILATGMLGLLAVRRRKQR